MDHPGALLGSVPAREATPLLRRFGFFGLRHDLRTHMYMHGLTLADEVQQSEHLLNTAMFMLEDVSVDDPFKAAVRLVKLKRGSMLRDVWSVLSGLGLLAKGVGMKVFQSNYMPERLKDLIINTAIRVNPNMVVREYQSINMPHKLFAYDIHGITEQAPNPDSRITLAETTDRFGVRRASIDWKVGVLEATSLMRAAETLRDEFARVGLPQPKLVDWIERREPETARLIDMAHSMGTTRMSRDPMAGVVDTDCRVHGVDGLYVAGGSVFPTSGHANPTLMILSLVIRLADHLKALRLGVAQPVGGAKESR
jgi:choline dehydrogenase-like flavoprotein